jgi:Asp/Glu/hydantoin racemase
MMVAIAQGVAGDGFAVVGATATRAPPMIVDPDALLAAAAEVVEIALANQDAYDGMIVAAFGDPGLAGIRAASAVPVVGIAEAAMLQAAEGGRRFGVATTTADLVTQINARADALGLTDLYTGIRVTQGDLSYLMADPERLRVALGQVVEVCIARDGAEAVIIGGGPLGQAAMALQSTFVRPIIAPIAAAVRRIVGVIG